MRSLLALLCVVLMAVQAKPRLRSRLSIPDRDESSPDLCLSTEYHVRCGPERHCERHCDNLFSPPRCGEHDPTDPKCYFPRCLCRAGYVRDKRGKCIRPKRCRVSFEEQFLRQDPDGLQLRNPQRFKQRRVRHEHNKKEKEENNYFW